MAEFAVSGTTHAKLAVRDIDDRVAFIDSIRALAALYVAICHSWYEPSNGYYDSWWLNKLGLSYGHLGVVVFIVVSGFCLMLPTARRGDHIRSVPEFYLRRVRRIVPPYWAALVLGLLVSFLVTTAPDGTAWGQATLPVGWPKVASYFFLVPNIFPDLPGGVVNYPLWTITTEFQIYLFFPVIVWSLPRLGALPTFVLALAIGMSVRLIHPWVALNYCTWFLALFVGGAIAARAVANNRRPTSSVLLWIAMSALFVVVCAILILGKERFFNQNYLPVWDVLLGVATAIALYHLSFGTIESRSPMMRLLALMMRLLAWKPLASIGLFSYSIYLIHAPMLHVLGKLYEQLGAEAPGLRFGLLLASLPIVVAASYVFFLAFEKPFLSTERQRAPAI